VLPAGSLTLPGPHDEVTMKKSVGLSLVAAIALVLAIGAGVAEEGGNMHNCAVCKPMMEQPGLIEHVKWEPHPIATGMIAVTTVDAGYEKAFDTAHAKMMAVVAKLEAGEKMELCPICQGMGKMSEAGAKFENIDTPNGHVMAVTSADPKVVAVIHDHAKMMAEMMKAHGEQHDEHHGG
jgi:hypothetical protein